MYCIEFHSHTIYSKDSLTTPETLINTCRMKGIDRIVVTDHNTIAGAIKAQEIDPELVIVGEEIMTTRGELLAGFVKYEIPKGLEPIEAIERLRDQDAFISVSHPFDRWRNGHWERDDLDEIAPLVDAIETFNARFMQPSFNEESDVYAKTMGLQATVGSDAHHPMEIGKATLTVPLFEDAASLKEVIHQATYQTALSSPLIHFTSRYAVWRKKYSKKYKDYRPAP